MLSLARSDLLDVLAADERCSRQPGRPFAWCRPRRWEASNIRSSNGRAAGHPDDRTPEREGYWAPGNRRADRHHTGVTEPIDDTPAPLVNVGTPRDARAAAALARYDERAPIPLVLSALLPLVVAPEPGHPVSVVIGVVSWLVFVVDFVVHERLLQRYLSSRLGKFDLLIVVFTAPWFLLPGAVSGGGIIVVLRLAR